MDPIFVCLLFGAAIALLMTLDSNLANSTHRNTFGLFLLYAIPFIFLYVPTVCSGLLGNAWCERLIVLREDISGWLGGDWLNTLWLLSGFIGFTIESSGTQSDGWRTVGRAFLAVFVAAFVLRFLAKLFIP
jgi:hypothetical protein